MDRPLRAVIFDYDGLIVDSERIEADLVIQIVGEWGTTISYEDFGHLFGSVDAHEHWDELIGGWCGRTLRELEDVLHSRVDGTKSSCRCFPACARFSTLRTRQG